MYTPYKILNKTNIIDKYNQAIVNKTNKKYDSDIISYSSYIPSTNQLVYSSRKTKNTNYKQEKTQISTISENFENIKNGNFALNALSHNLMIAKVDNKYIGIGGILSGGHNSGKYNKGLYYIESSKGISCNLKNWSNPKLIINKNQSLKQNYGTHFDSYQSFLYNETNSKYYLYTRYNKNQGDRQCQVFISDNYDKYDKGQLVTFTNIKKICVYSQYVYRENNRFIGIFRYYIYKSNDHVECRGRLKLLLAESHNGINFTIINKDFFVNCKISFLCSYNHKITDLFNFYYVIDMNSNNLMEYKMRIGGYSHFEQINKESDGSFNIEIPEKQNTIYLNYETDEDGYILIKTDSKEEKLTGNHIKYEINLSKYKPFNKLSISIDKAKLYEIY